MNVQEMHIEIDISTQKIRSNYYRKFLDSEIDWLLNKNVDRFIKDRIKQDTDSLGFDATEIDLDALRTIAILDRQLPAFQIESDAVRAELPGNYSFLIDDFSNTIEKCDIRNYNAATKTVATELYIYTFPLTQSVLESGPYYKNMNLTLNDISIFNSVGLPGLFDKTELWAVRDYILNQLSNYIINLLQLSSETTLDFYWETFGGYTSPNSILAVSSVRQTGLNQLTIDGSNTAGEESTISKNYIPNVNAGSLACNRLIRGSMRSRIRTSTFCKTISSSPISAVSGNQLKIYCDTKFIVSKSKVSYIRKPAKINLLLSQSCDLAPEFHQEICDRVSLYIKELTDAPDWEVKLRDMMMNKD